MGDSSWCCWVVTHLSSPNLALQVLECCRCCLNASTDGLKLLHQLLTVMLSCCHRCLGLHHINMTQTHRFGTRRAAGFDKCMSGRTTSISQALKMFHDIVQCTWQDKDEALWCTCCRADGLCQQIYNGSRHIQPAQPLTSASCFLQLRRFSSAADTLASSLMMRWLSWSASFWAVSRDSLRDLSSASSSLYCGAHSHTAHTRQHSACC